MSQLACIWTTHATQRLGERYGSKSDKVKTDIENMIAREQYTVIEDNQPAPNKLAIRLDVRDNPIELVIAIDKNRPVVVTVLPKFVNRERREKWWKQ